MLIQRPFPLQLPLKRHSSDNLHNHNFQHGREAITTTTTPFNLPTRAGESVTSLSSEPCTTFAQPEDPAIPRVKDNGSTIVKDGHKTDHKAAFTINIHKVVVYPVSLSQYPIPEHSVYGAWAFSSAVALSAHDGPAGQILNSRIFEDVGKAC